MTPTEINDYIHNLQQLQQAMLKTGLPKSSLPPSKRASK
jgi:hypothetical protein